MKKFLCFIFAICIGTTTLYFDDATGARNSRRTKRNTNKVVYGTPTENDCNVEIDYCFNRYCFDKKTLSAGVYSKCGAESASTILMNVEECLKARKEIKQLNFIGGCKNYTYNYIVKLLSNKDSIETGLKRNTKECQKATKALQAAKQCYNIMISSDGTSSLDLYNILEANCGFEASGDSYMLNRFFEAGDYGASNIGALRDLQRTGQFTQKRENWRQVVDATLAGYTEMAELACGAEDFKLTKVNRYALDKRDNTAMLQLKAQAIETGKQTANRMVNRMFREDDCLNSALPEGGLYWKYTKNGDPDCKIVCKEGWAISKNSSTCVKIQEKTQSIPDLNIGTDWVGLYGKKPEDPEVIIIEGKEPEDPEPTPSNDCNVVEKNEKEPITNGHWILDNSTTKQCIKVCDEGFVLKDEKCEPKTQASSEPCSEKTNKGTWYPNSKGKEALCDVFCPNGKGKPCIYYYHVVPGYPKPNGSIHSGEEYFCTGPQNKNWNTWYNMTLSEINSLLGTSYTAFGEGTYDHDGDYSKNAARAIACHCRDGYNWNKCTEQDTTPIPPQSDPKKECENKPTTEGVQSWTWNDASKTCLPICKDGYSRNSNNSGCKKIERPTCGCDTSINCNSFNGDTQVVKANSAGGATKVDKELMTKYAKAMMCYYNNNNRGSNAGNANKYKNYSEELCNWAAKNDNLYGNDAINANNYAKEFLSAWGCTSTSTQKVDCDYFTNYIYGQQNIKDLLLKDFDYGSCRTVYINVKNLITRNKIFTLTNSYNDNYKEVNKIRTCLCANPTWCDNQVKNEKVLAAGCLQYLQSSTPQSCFKNNIYSWINDEVDIRNTSTTGAWNPPYILSCIEKANFGDTICDAVNKTFGTNCTGDRKNMIKGSCQCP